jgi:ABC-2 type transport system ATP-binding protein
VTGADGAVTLTSEAPLAHVGTLADWAFRGGFDLPDLDVRRPTLEEVYLALTTSDRKD